jgi:hypothetical protein
MHAKRFIPLIFLVVRLYSQENDVLFKVNLLFDGTQPKTMGLSFTKGLETVTIFAPGEQDKKYNNGVVLFPFNRMLYAQWQSSVVDEDGADTQVYYCRSSNGKTWSRPTALFMSPMQPTKRILN